MFLAKQTLKTIETLKSQPWFEAFHLVGGSALALQYKHRYSEDLDFFTQKDFSVMELKPRLSQLGRLEITREHERTLIGTFNRVKVTFLYYAYPLLKPSLTQNYPCPLADPLDIGLMKVEAIAQRGARRDFVDLYFICQREKSLSELLKLYPKKYGKIATPLYHLLKSLCYFDDAEKQGDIATTPRVSWTTIKRFFEREVSLLAKSQLEI